MCAKSESGGWPNRLARFPIHLPFSWLFSPVFHELIGMKRSSQGGPSMPQSRIVLSLVLFGLSLALLGAAGGLLGGLLRLALRLVI
jgi:hypothetical protein